MAGHRAPRRARPSAMCPAAPPPPPRRQAPPLLRDPLGLVLEEQLAPRLVRLEREARLAVGFPLALGRAARGHALREEIDRKQEVARRGGGHRRPGEPAERAQ